MSLNHDFFGRKREVEKLSMLLRSGDFEFIRISGRRRIGKTEFVKYTLRKIGLVGEIVFHTPIESNIEIESAGAEV